MFGSGILDTVIGLVFVFLLVSLLVTITNEIIAAIFMSRAKWLRRGIDRMIGSDWMKKLYAHPLVAGSARADPILSRNPGPSYIPSRAFANVLMSIVQSNAAAIVQCQQGFRKTLDAAAGAGATLDDLKSALSTAARKMGADAQALATAASRVVEAMRGADASTADAWLNALAGEKKKTSGGPGLAPLVAELQALESEGKARGATVESLKARLDAIEARRSAEAGMQATIAGDIARYLDAGGSTNARAWLRDVAARVTELRAARPDLTDLLNALDNLVQQGVDARAGIDDLRRGIDTAVVAYLSDPAMAALKDELTAMGKRLQGPYTVADAVADVHWFIDGMSARYVRQMLETLPDGDLKTSLLTLYEDASHDVEKLKENIEVWFNNGMDRVNGWYKRQSQIVLIVLSLVLTVAMNVDTILVFRHLQTYPAAREALVQQAEQFAAKNPRPEPGALTVANGEAYSGSLPLQAAATTRTVTLTSDNPDVTFRQQAGTKVENGQALVTVPANASQASFIVDVALGDKDQPGTATIRSVDPAAEVRLTLTPSLMQQFRTVQKTLNDLTIPIGWVDRGTQAEVRNGLVLPEFFNFGAQWRVYRQHVLGWLLTALAATLGAPFWFDTLNRIISIRAAGKAPEEEPKPPKTVPVPVEPGQSPQEAERVRQGTLRRF